MIDLNTVLPASERLDIGLAYIHKGDLALGPEIAEEMAVPMVEDLRLWGEWLAPSEMLEYQESSENWRKCLVHLLTSQVEAWRGGMRHTVGQLLDDLARDLAQPVDDGLSIDKAQRLLAQAGLGLKIIGRVEPDGGTLAGLAVAIPNESMLVMKQFKDTVWAGAPGASVWKSALRQGPKDIILTDAGQNRVRINGVQMRCVLVDMAAFNRAE